MSKEIKNNVASIMVESKEITDSIKEASKSTIKTILEGVVKDYVREAANDEEEEVEEKDYEVMDAEEKKDDANAEPEKADKEAEEKSEGAEEEKAEEVPAGEGDEWSEFEDLKVSDNVYDLTGVNDSEKAVKVYKLLSDEDNVVVKKDGDNVTIEDKDTGAEYVIDLGSDEEEVDECIKEGADDIAGLPSPEDEFEVELDDEEDETIGESKENCNEMKENKEKVYEVDLGYTDDYQDKDAIEGLEMNEVGDGKDVDAGVPKGAEKPFAGDAENAGEPFEEKINEDEEILLDDEVAPEEQPVEEGTNQTLPNRRKKVKSHTSAFKEGPKVAHEDSVAGQYKAMSESVIKKAEKVLEENKKLRNALTSIKKSLQEAYVVNVSLGNIVNLITENTVTEQEKKDIVNRFTEVKTVAAANALYESIGRELKKGAKQSLTLESKASSANGSIINEEKIYESEDLNSMRNLMERVLNC